MRAVDDAILADLRGAGLNIMDGFVIPATAGKVVDYPVPYAVYYSNIGNDENPRLSGRRGRRDVFFSITYVGLNRNQTKWLGEKIRARLQGRRFVVAGYAQVGLTTMTESQRIRRDDDAIRPDGAPLFYGVDNYDIPLSMTYEGVV